MERNYNVLLKSNWSVRDIQSYLGCSMEYAKSIKNMVIKNYGVVELDRGKKETTVSGDCVIKVIGGENRLTEAQIYIAICNAKGED